MDFIGIQKTLKDLITAERYDHSCRVADTTKHISLSLNLDEQSAFLGGLLHDCAKDISINHSEFVFSDDQKQLYVEFPAIWHSFVVEKVGSFYFPNVDNDIFKAAKYHSTGAMDMTTLAKILFVADYIEPGRSYIKDSSLLSLAKKDLNKAVFEVASLKLSYLVSKKQKIHHFLFECYDFYSD
jgi:nicotinate-nucleotide adenylyltransferase